MDFSKIEFVSSDEGPCPDFTGVWLKDKERSDCMEHVFDVAKLNFLLRKAVRLLKGLEIKQETEKFYLDVIR